MAPLKGSRISTRRTPTNIHHLKSARVYDHHIILRAYIIIMYRRQWPIGVYNTTTNIAISAHRCLTSKIWDPD